MKNRTIAKRYGGALFALALETGGEDRIFSDMEKIRSVVELELNFLKSLSDERIAVSKRVKAASAIADVLDLGDTAKNFLRLVILKKRTHLIQFIANDFIARIEKKRRVAISRAWVANRAALEDVQRGIAAVIGKILGTKAVCDADVDENLIGGFVVRIGDVLYDASVAGKLSKMREAFLENSTY